MPTCRPPSAPRRTPSRLAGRGRRPAAGSAPAGGPRFTSRAVVLGLVLLVLVISYASSLRAWLDQRQQIADATHQIETTRSQVADLGRDKRRWSDDAYVEQQARARLGFLMPGETGYRVIGPDGTALDAQVDPGPSDLVAPRHWYDTMWDSARRAGSTG